MSALLLSLLIVCVGALLALQRSSWAVDYAIIMFVFNRGLRRYVDWINGQFDPFSPISLTPLLVACLMLLPFLSRFNRLSHGMRRAFLLLFVAIGYAFVLGFARIQVAALYALAEFLAPVALLGYAATAWASEIVRDRWIRTTVWCAVLASAYGWYQYLTIPPWDGMWLVQSKMVGYMGIPEPTQMSVFSTMHERGVLAGYLGLAVVPMIVNARWRTFLSWPAVVLVLSCILLTLSRGGLIFAALGVLGYVLVNRGAGLLPTLLAVGVVGIAAMFGVEHLPGSDRIQNRFVSLGNMREDGSYKGRVEIQSHGLGLVASNPIGYGLGATGLASRVNSGHGGVIGDGGYTELFITFGWLGGICMVLALWRIWQELGERYRWGEKNKRVLLARGLMVALIPMFFVGNLLSGISLFWLSFGAALNPDWDSYAVDEEELEDSEGSMVSDEARI